MATNDSLDDFFKKKDRKSKKQSGLLTNNEELLNRLVINTSLTSTFKENMHLVDDDDEQLDDELMNEKAAVAETQSQPKASKPKTSNTNVKQPQEQPAKAGNNDQPDEWEDFLGSNSKYEQLRLKFKQDNDDDDDYYFGENSNENENNGSLNGDVEQKDKPVWKVNEIKAQPIEATVAPIVEETPAPSKPTDGVYRPPAMRATASVAIVSGPTKQTPKKKQLNIASTDDFPTLKSAVDKK